MNEIPFGITFSLSDITVDNSGKVIIANTKLSKIVRESNELNNTHRDQLEDKNYSAQCGCHNYVQGCGGHTLE